ncbi:phosphoribosyl transferase [Aspergillus egyptiacus]|nr:phosphoribosyl transferase [Aspergillus egyptiacus]
MMPTLPPNTLQIQDETLPTLLTQLRDRTLPPSTVRSLIRSLSTTITKNLPPLPETENAPESDPETIAIIVVLRSGLAMFDGFIDTLSASLPTTTSTAIYHIGIFRDEASLDPVEYYNKLPRKPRCIRRAYVLDPLIATGGTAGAVVTILKEWGIDDVTFVSILASQEGLRRAAGVWPEGSRFVVAGIDPEVDGRGFIAPGVGDIGDRLFGTVFK